MCNIFLTEEKHVGERIDKVIAELYPDFTRSYIKTLLENGEITVSGKSVKAGYKLKAKNEIRVNIPESKPLSVCAEDIPLDIVYEDDSLLVINKPAGMVVHPAVGNYSGTLVNALLKHCGESLSSINGVLRPGIVHRIDKDTTGLLVVAKGDKAHKNLSEQLKDRTLKRQYITLVHGNIKEDSGTIEKNIARSTKDRKKMAVAKENGREARTNFEVVERFSKYTLVRCFLDTGRTHQIRVHMASIGHQVFGDKTYGIKNEEYKARGQLLHAQKITFIHPESGETKEFEAPLPREFNSVLKKIRDAYGNK